MHTVPTELSKERTSMVAAADGVVAAVAVAEEAHRMVRPRRVGRSRSREEAVGIRTLLLRELKFAFVVFEL